MRYIFWDIDGTLLKTGLAGYDALIEVIKKRFNVDNFKFSHPLAGSTDAHIIKQIIIDVKGKCTAADAAGLLIDYHKLLLEHLPTHNGTLMPNIEKTLDYIAENETGYKSCLLTGNTTIGSFAKLTHYGIDHHFSNSFYACGELSENRNELAQIAYRRLSIIDKTLTPDKIIVIGDTPNDILCAQAIGAKSIIILAGSSYDEEALAKYNPSLILQELPSNPQEFIDILNKLD